MTIQQLINRLNQSGDMQWRNTAEVRVIDCDGHVIGDNIEVFDVKDGCNSVDITIPSIDINRWL